MPRGRRPPPDPAATRAAQLRAAGRVQYGLTASAQDLYALLNGLVSPALRRQAIGLLKRDRHEGAAEYVARLGELVAR
jgi:hypothetical protein